MVGSQKSEIPKNWYILMLNISVFSVSSSIHCKIKIEILTIKAQNKGELKSAAWCTKFPLYAGLGEAPDDIKKESTSLNLLICRRDNVREILRNPSADGNRSWNLQYIYRKNFEKQRECTLRRRRFEGVLRVGKCIGRTLAYWIK